MLYVSIFGVPRLTICFVKGWRSRSCGFVYSFRQSGEFINIRQRHGFRLMYSSVEFPQYSLTDLSISNVNGIIRQIRNSPFITETYTAYLNALYATMEKNCRAMISVFDEFNAARLKIEFPACGT